MSEVTIRIWKGNTVRQVMTVSDTGSSSIGAVGGAGNSSKVDIEFDPWANVIVDHRAQWPVPVSTREVEPKQADD
jgi:hypothetical protein